MYQFLFFHSSIDIELPVTKCEAQTYMYFLFGSGVQFFPSGVFLLHLAAHSCLRSMSFDVGNWKKPILESPLFLQSPKLQAFGIFVDVETMKSNDHLKSNVVMSKFCLLVHLLTTEKTEIDNTGIASYSDNISPIQNSIFQWN